MRQLRLVIVIDFESESETRSLARGCISVRCDHWFPPHVRYPLLAFEPALASLMLVGSDGSYTRRRQRNHALWLNQATAAAAGRDPSRRPPGVPRIPPEKSGHFAGSLEIRPPKRRLP